MSEASRPAVAFIVAHPDDVAFAMGGTALLLKERCQLHVLCASKASAILLDRRRVAAPIGGGAARREQEEAAACALLDAELEFLGEIDGEIHAGREVCRRVADRLRRIRPRAVFSMNAFETPDHNAAFSIALHALHLGDLFWTTELYASVHRTAYRAHADLHVNISSVIDEKRRLIRGHRSQLKSEDIVERILEHNRFQGIAAWCDHAEAFSSSLVPMAVRWKRKAGSILMELAA